jgi:uncharacterized RDD family membrane protein YckC
VDYDDILTISTPEGVDLHLTLAGPASRFVSALVDIVIQLVLLICAAVVLGTIGSSAQGGTLVLVWFVLSFALITFYDVFFEVFNSGRTPGKLINGLRVVRVEGHPVTFLTSAIRNIIRPIDFLPSVYLLGAVVILATRKNQRVGDVVAGTIVVRDGSHGLRRGSRRSADPPPPVRDVEVPPHGAWDTSRITAEELAAVRQFLERRHDIQQSARAELARTLAERLRPKVTGAPPQLRGEQFLTALVAAKLERGA